MPNYLDIEVDLDEVVPRIWRRFLLGERATFLDLHHAIQDACGWQNAHLFAFRDADGAVIAGVPTDFGFTPPDPRCGQGADRGVPQAALVSDLRIRLRRQLAPLGAVAAGRHGRRAVHPSPARRCTCVSARGLRGLPGYEDVVAVAAGGEATYHDTEVLREWCAGWDPEFFDLEGMRASFDR